MSNSQPAEFNPATFTGIVRLFPLPNLVVFPHILQPLHVFEDRYRDLMAEAVATDRLIAMAVLAPGWHKNYEGRPPIRPIACLGRIATFHRLPDGRYNLLLEGLQRVRVVGELPAKRSFREARGELIEDAYPAQGSALRPALKSRLVAVLKQFLTDAPEGMAPLQRLLATEAPLGVLSDLLAYAVNIDLETKVALLSEPNVDRRAQILLDTFARVPPKAAEQGTFPPDFSLN